VIVRELLIKIGFDVDERELAKLDAGLKKVVRSGAAVAKTADRARNSLSRFSAASRNRLALLNKEIGTVNAGLGRTALAFGAAFGAGLAGRALVGTISNFQKLRAQLVTIEQDEMKAENAFKRLQQFATTTPFQLSNVVAGFARLRAVGINPTNEDLIAMGDISAGMGKDIATTGEAERLKQFGIIMRTQGEQVTINFKGQKIKLKKDAKEISQALFNLGRANFAGGMERQMDTIGGAFSNLIDNLAKFANTVGRGGLSKELNLFVRELTATAGEGESLAIVLGRTLGFAVRLLRDGLKFAKENATLLAIAFGAIFANIGITLLLQFVAGIKAAAIAAKAGVAPYLLLAAALGLFALAIDDIIGFFQGKESVIGEMLSQVFGVTGPDAVFALQAALSALLVILLAVASVMLGPITVALLAVAAIITSAIMIITELRANWDLIVNTIKDGATEIAMALLLLLGPLGLIPAAMLLIWSNWDTITENIGDAIDWLMQKFSDLAEAAMSLPGVGTALEVGGSALDFIGGGAADPGVDAGRRLNEVTNNRQASTRVRAPITVNVDGTSGDSDAIVASLERQLSSVISGIFDEAASDFEGALD